jgi:hypothetical protein
MMYYDTLDASISDDRIIERVMEMVVKGDDYDCCICGNTTKNLAVYIPSEGKKHILGPIREGERKVVIYALCQSCNDHTNGDKLEALVIRGRN